MVEDYRMYINGEWVDAIDGRTIEDHNPYTGELFASVAAGNREDTKEAISAASAAFPGWAHTPPEQRALYFLKAADILESSQQDIIRILTEEAGSTFGVGMFQLGFTPGLLREAAAQVHGAMGEIIPADLPGAFFMSIRQPVGVVAGISPWNVPLILSLRAITLPIAYGNTAVLKPSSETPVSGGIAIADIFDKAGFPAGVLNVVTNCPGSSEEIGNEFITNPKVRRISFTGSTETGRWLAENAGRNLKRLSLELGGKDPLIVLADADIDQAVNAAAFGAFFHQGQVCMSVERIIVEKPAFEEFVDKLAKKAEGLKVGDPRDPDTIIGPLINQNQLDKVRMHVEEAIADGAKILCGGKYDRLCYYPTVLTDVNMNMKVFSEETFGPIAPVISVKDADEAIDVANNCRYGLSAGIFTGDFAKGLDLAERIESGMVHINDSSLHDEPQVPFGGMKDSGYGRHGGRAALEEFTELRWITMQKTPRQYPF